MEQSNVQRSRYTTGRETQVKSTVGARQTQSHATTRMRQTQSQPVIGARQGQTSSIESVRSARTTGVVRRTQSDPIDYYDDELSYDEVYPTRTPSSARRYQGDTQQDLERGRATADSQQLAEYGDYVSSYATGRQRVPARRTATQTSIPAVPAASTLRRRTGEQRESGGVRRNPEPVTQVERKGPRFHWLVYVGIVMLVMVGGWIGLTTVSGWWQATQDDWHYGRPRTFHTDFYVGHNETPNSPSHFIAMNLKRHVQIIEFQGGDASKARVYTGVVLVGQDQDLAVVTLDFKDVNGDKKPDMIVNVQQSRFVYINENGGFRALRQGEKVQIPS